MSVVEADNFIRRASAEGERLLAARYGGVDQGFVPLLTPAIAGLLAHRSVRSFAAQPLPQGALETIIAAAQSAPNSSNLQQWSVVAIESADRRANFSRLCGGQDAIVQAPLYLAWIADMSRMQALAEREGGATLAAEYTDVFVESVVDASLAAQAALTALESLGLGAVIIGGLRNRVDAVARELNLPPLAVPVFGMCVGWPSVHERAAVKPRFPQSMVLHREVYDARAATAHVDAFDLTTLAHQRAHGRAAIGWLQPSLDKATRLQRLGDRAFLRQALGRLGLLLK